MIVSGLYNCGVYEARAADPDIDQYGESMVSNGVKASSSVSENTLDWM